MQFISPNELLTALPPVIYERLGPHLQRVRLEAGRILFDVGATIDYAYFIVLTDLKRLLPNFFPDLIDRG